jgi:hypothetical protein
VYDGGIAATLSQACRRVGETLAAATQVAAA